jgi:hypothetical protein
MNDNKKPKQLPLPTVQQLAQISMAAEEGDPFDWGNLKIDKQAAYEMMASHALELYATQGPYKDVILLSSLTKSIVENFILNIKLEKYEKQSKQ